MKQRRQNYYEPIYILLLILLRYTFFIKEQFKRINLFFHQLFLYLLKQL